MANHRMEAGFEHLREAMAEIIREIVEFPPGVLVTVLGAKLTANTAHARIELSVYPETAQAEVVKILGYAERDIKNALAEHVRLRRMPRIHYIFNGVEATAAKVEEALNEMKKKGEL